MKSLSRLVSIFFIGTLLFTSFFPVQAATSLPPFLRSDMESTEVLEREIEEKTRFRANELQRTTSSQFELNQYDRFKVQFLESEEPVEEPCSDDNSPELDLETIALQSVTESGDQSALVYHFDVTVQNFHDTVAYGPAFGEDVILSVIDLEALYAAGEPADFTYKEILNGFGLNNYFLTNAEDNILQLDCGESYTLEDVQVKLPKSQSSQNLMFLIDPGNAVQEVNDSENQTANTLFNTVDNNYDFYDIHQPYDTFEMGLVDYSNESGLLSFNSDFSNNASSSEQDLIALGYGFEVEVFDMDAKAFFIGDDSKIIDYEEEQLELHYNYLLPDYDFSAAADLLDSTPLSLGEAWSSENDLLIDALGNQLATLTMVTPAGEKIRLYGGSPVSVKGSVVDCIFDEQNCTGLLFTRISPLSIESDGSTLPDLASEFEFCNTTDHNITVDSFKFEVITRGTADGAIVDEYFLDGESHWAPTSYAFNEPGYIQIQNSEIVLLDSLLVHPGLCHSLSIFANEVDAGAGFQSINILEVNATDSAYFSDEHNDPFGNGIVLLGGNEWHSDKLIGSTLIYQSEVGVNFLHADDFYARPLGYYDLELGHLLIATNPDQTFNVNELEFTIDSPWANSDMVVEVTIVPVAPWYAPYDLYDEAATENLVQSIDLPADGVITINDLDINLGYGERVVVQVKVNGNALSSGLLTGAFTAMDAPMDNAYIHGAPWYLKGSYPLHNGIFNLLAFPLERSVEFVDGDAETPNQLEVHFNPRDWFDNYAWYSFANEWFLYSGHLHFSADSSIPEDSLLKISDWEFALYGNFDVLDLSVSTEGWQLAPNETLVSVSPGQSFMVPLPNLLPDQYFSIHVDLENYPDLDYLDLRTLQLVAYPLTAALEGENYDVVLVEDKWIDGAWTTLEKLFDSSIMNLRKYILGKEFLHVASDNNSLFTALENINELEPDEGVVMNQFCLESFGRTEASEFRFIHDAHDFQPFTEVLLVYNDNEILFPEDKWAKDEVIFYPTPDIPFMYGSHTCFSLVVRGPKEPMTNAFFDLVEVKAVVKDAAVSAPVFAAPNSNLELSPENRIHGTRYDFIDA